MVKVVQVMVGGFDKNFSYLVFNENNSKGVIIDPTGDKNAIENAIKESKVEVVMQLFTHSHPDHTELLEEFESKGVTSFKPTPKILGEVEEIEVAGLRIKVLHTPGHTKESVCFLIEDNLFSGDTIFVKGIGTTDYGGNDLELKKSLEFLLTLTENVILWPGHDYGGAHSTLKVALSNSHLSPPKHVLEKIKKKVADYESTKGKKKF